MKAFISSTFPDLKKHRDAVKEALERGDCQVGRMETFCAQPETPLDASLKEVDKCDLFVGIYAHRYGSIPPGREKSFIELELEHADQQSMPVFTFVVNPQHKWPAKFIDSGDSKKKMDSLKAKIDSKYVREVFTTPPDLATKVVASILRYVQGRGNVQIALSWVATHIEDIRRRAIRARRHLDSDTEEERLEEDIHGLVVGVNERFTQLGDFSLELRELAESIGNVSLAYGPEDKALSVLERMAEISSRIWEHLKSRQGSTPVERKLTPIEQRMEPTHEEQEKDHLAQRDELGKLMELGQRALEEISQQKEEFVKLSGLVEKTGESERGTKVLLERFLSRVGAPNGELSGIISRLSLYAGQTTSLEDAFGGPVEDVTASKLTSAIVRRIDDHSKVATVYTPDKYPREHAETQFALGLERLALAKITDRGAQSEKAIEAFTAALGVYTPEHNPLDYAMTLGNLANAHQTLATVKNTEQNCEGAIKAYKKALRVYSLKDYPIDYATTQNNLGNAYGTLADVRDREQNCNRAIKAYKKALRVRTPEDYRVAYAMTQNNLGNVCRMLAEVRDRERNCKRAIKAYQEALRVRTLEDYPVDYATTQNNLGNAYGTLADVQDKKQNCERAIKAYQEALRVRTLEDYPVDYATTKNNLGNVLWTLAQVRDKEQNCEGAIKAYQEAFRVCSLKDYPVAYALTQNNLGGAYAMLAEVRDRERNCKRAIKAYQEALRVRTLQDYPVAYATTQNNLGGAYGMLAQVRDRERNCKRAIKAYQEALRVRTLQDYPDAHKSTLLNMRRLRAFCSDGGSSPSRGRT